MTETVPTPNPCPTCGQPASLITITTPEPLSEAEYEDIKRRFQAEYAKADKRLALDGGWIIEFEPRPLGWVKKIWHRLRNVTT